MINLLSDSIYRSLVILAEDFPAAVCGSNLIKRKINLTPGNHSETFGNTKSYYIIFESLRSKYFTITLKIQ